MIRFNISLLLQSTSSAPPSVTGPSTSSGDTISISFSCSTMSFVGILTISNHTLCNTTWVTDSGATNHVCYDSKLFVSIDTSIVNSFNMPTGSTVKISGIGSIKLNKDITLQNVLFIP